MAVKWTAAVLVVILGPMLVWIGVSRGPRGTGEQTAGSMGRKSGVSTGLENFTAPLTETSEAVRRELAAPKPCGNSYSWDSVNKYAGFYTFICLNVSGIHVAQTYTKSIVILDRSDTNNTYFKFPPNYTRNAYAEEIAWVPGFPQRALDIKSNVFCSAGGFMPDGTLLSVGGSSDASMADPLLNGSFSIRSFKPCNDSTCDFVLSGTMTSKRWYPTTQNLPNGRMLIVGGANVYGNIPINAWGKNNPTVEYWPPPTPAPPNYPFYVKFLDDTMPFNLYPFVHLLPSGRVFMFAGQLWTLFDTSKNQEIPGPLPDGSYPPLAVTDATGAPVMRSYPVSGTSALFPLSSANNYTAEVMICGGNNNQATYVAGDRKKSTQVNNYIWADYWCWRIKPEVLNATWVGQPMCLDGPACSSPVRRVMGDAVLLVDGSLLILNGAQQGYQGLNQKYANTAQLQPMLYYPSNYSFSNFTLPKSRVARVYHSSAVLLHDATVLVTGSNPNENLATTGTFPTEFRTEIFAPPYLLWGQPRPVFTNAVTKNIGVKALFSVYFNATQISSVQPITRFRFALAYPGFSTHNQRHCMRHIFLDTVAISPFRTNITYLAIVRAPPSLNISPPGLYWLHVMDNGVPNVSGVAINVTASNLQSWKSTVTF